MYWRNGGWHVPAVVAQLLGMVAASMAIDTSVWVGPLSKAANGADFSAWMGLAVGGGIYFVLARKHVKAEADATERPRVRGRRDNRSRGAVATGGHRDGIGSCLSPAARAIRDNGDEPMRSLAPGRPTRGKMRR